MLYIVCYILYVIYYLLYIICYISYVMYYMLYIICYILSVKHYMLYIAYHIYIYIYTIYSIYMILYLKHLERSPGRSIYSSCSIFFGHLQGYQPLHRGFGGLGAGAHLSETHPGPENLPMLGWNLAGWIKWWVLLGQKIQENPHRNHGKIDGFPIEIMGKSMVSCNFSRKPTNWMLPDFSAERMFRWRKNEGGKKEEI